MTHKICPQCQSPAPLEATFCGQCGRQYKTQFVSNAQPSPLPGGFAPPQEFQPGRSSRALPVAIGVMACVVALLTLSVVNRFKHSDRLSPVSRAGGPARVQVPGVPESDALQTLKSGSDPITDEARRVVDRENGRLQSAPPPEAIGPDGRVHLRGGGSITREQWEDANRRVHGSRTFPDPMPPPPVN